jgi:predicted Zn-dependent peptidase
LVKTLLTAGNAAILQQALTENEGLLYQVLSNSNTSRFGGEYALSFCTSKPKVNQIINVIEKHIDSQF